MTDPVASLTNRTALVTGASRKLGAHIARELARCGARVVVNYNTSQAEADAVVRAIQGEGGEATAIQADVSDPAAVRRLVEQGLQAFGSIDILVNNAGPYTDLPLTRLPAGDWDWIMNANVRAAYLAAQLVFPSMQKGGWGRIVNISAGSAFVRNHSIYGLAKNAMLTLTETLALEMAPQVAVYAIAPGLIDDPNEPESVKEPMRMDSPLKKLVTFDEVARMACLLCSPLFDTVTGQVIVMDGGQTLPRAMTPGEG